MNRAFACFAAILLAGCFATAQTPTPSPAAAQAPVTTTDAPEVAQFQKIEDTWSKAVNERDQYSLELVLSPLFVDISATGDITTRNQQLALVIAGVDHTLHIAQRVITVRMMGDIAVANGTYTLHHKVNTATVDENGVFTHVFERVRGGWICVNSQRTALHEDAPGKSKKPSTIESPFHIPLFGKSN
jgi:ketosteroid isomerase-like protein